MTISQLALHQVGNKYLEEDVLLSQELLEVSEEVKENLSIYFSKPFGTEDYYNFYHSSDLEMNEVFTFVSRIFTEPSRLLEESQNLCRHLYETSSHPKIKSGEFYVVYFEHCLFEGEEVNAVGLFKSENKDTFLKVNRKGGNFEIHSEKGVNINKLDKGCLIFNTDKENGFVVSVVDHTNRGGEARFWMDDFLRVRERNDAYHKTQNALELCRDFIKDGLNREFEVSKAEEAELLNRSVKFFKERQNFNLDEYSEEVIAQPEVIEKFKSFRNVYAEERELEIEDDFELSAPAVKKQSKNFKSVIKLDKNFHIYVHGNPNLIQRGEDEYGKFYKVYFREES